VFGLSEKLSRAYLEGAKGAMPPMATKNDYHG